MAPDPLAEVRAIATSPSDWTLRTKQFVSPAAFPAAVEVIRLHRWPLNHTPPLIYTRTESTRRDGSTAENSLRLHRRRQRLGHGTPALATQTLKTSICAKTCITVFRKSCFTLGQTITIMQKKQKGK